MATTVYSSISSISPRRALQNKHLVREKSLKSTTAITNMAPKKIGICSKFALKEKKENKFSHGGMSRQEVPRRAAATTLTPFMQL